MQRCLPVFFLLNPAPAQQLRKRPSVTQGPTGLRSPVLENQGAWNVRTDLTLYKYLETRCLPVQLTQEITESLSHVLEYTTYLVNIFQWLCAHSKISSQSWPNPDLYPMPMSSLDPRLGSDVLAALWRSLHGLLTAGPEFSKASEKMWLGPRSESGHLSVGLTSSHSGIPRVPF